MVPPPVDPEHDVRRVMGVTPSDAQLTAGLKRLASDSGKTGWRLGSRFRNAFLTGLVIVGPVTITLWLMWGVIHWIDAWIKPLLPTWFNPDTYLPFPVPGFGLVIAVFGLTLIGALAANLLGRALVSSGELMMSRTPIVRNVYGALKQIFESVISTTGPSQSFQKVGMIEFPSKEIWSLVFVTGETTGEIKDVQPGGEGDLLTVFMPTGIVPPTGFICFVPRSNVVFLNMTVEEAAKIILSGGIVMPNTEQEKLKLLAEAAAKKKSRFRRGGDKPAA
ncbi:MULTISPECIES: DUF502 domain-containing protein [unclassified Hyphomicrobium]|jgi:uncharacterized membrane protein|uniref:DUF502 domain-containing protein n=1 Tax=unclassified Hyphomicrobium TaxID=2619925 RepID=UPI000213DF56|nr:MULTISPECIES: DUF502 domain-containing protein [unclassified Hyphomicrobium]CCB65155.1 conserved protein of unknown function; putative membrane protein [Hyphomicrobium sp. MC1]